MSGLSMQPLSAAGPYGFREIGSISLTHQQLSQVALPHLGNPSQPLSPAGRDLPWCQANPRRKVTPPVEALHRRCEGVHRHRADLSHPRNRHQPPQLLVLPHDRAHLLVDLVMAAAPGLDRPRQVRGGNGFGPETS